MLLLPVVGVNAIATSGRNQCYCYQWYESMLLLPVVGINAIATSGTNQYYCYQWYESILLLPVVGIIAIATLHESCLFLCSLKCIVVSSSKLIADDNFAIYMYINIYDYVMCV